jgi:hypothetical protein
MAHTEDIGHQNTTERRIVKRRSEKSHSPPFWRKIASGQGNKKAVSFDGYSSLLVLVRFSFI